MTTTANIFICVPGGATKPVFRGKYEFQHLPREDDHIVVSGSGPWQDMLKVVNVNNRAIETNVPEVGRFEPSTRHLRPRARRC